jgi:hypothetical protein
MDKLKLREIVKTEVQWYKAGGHNLQAFGVYDDEQQIYSVVVVDHPERHRPAGVVVLARIVEDHVVIEEDNTDRPLYKHLMQAGIPREKIICAYAGETLPVQPMPS